MIPSAWLLQALCSLVPLAGALLLKWWVTWFVLGQNFTRTTALCALSLVGTYGVAWLTLACGAWGPLDFDSRGEAAIGAAAWWVAAVMVGFMTFVGETAWLRFGMARLLRPDWRWRRYDRVGYALAHVLWLMLAWSWSLWRAGAFRVS